MPSAPEFRCGAGNIGIVEVFEEVESENSAKAYGHIGITGKVVINLNGKHQYSKPDCRSALFCKVTGKIGFGKASGNVCDKHFFGKTHKKSCGSGPDIFKIFFSVIYFHRNVGVSYDRACHKLGIKRNVHKELHIIMLGFHVALINVYGIA